MKKILIVGGVAGGASTAARLRRLDEQAEIIMFEKGEYISFANCGLPYHVGRIIPERRQLLVQTVEGMKNRFRIDVRVRSEVISIDRAKKEVTVLDHLTGTTYTESFDLLLLSTGAAPLRPSIPGIDNPRIFTLRNMADMDAIIAAIDVKPGGEAVIIGGGFIGLEMAENFHRRGFKVNLVEMAEQVMLNLDRDVAAIIHNHLRQKGLNLILQDGVTAFENEGNATTVILHSGQKITADLVILAIGVLPDTNLAKEAGLALGLKGAIKVNAALQTSDPSIYAVGDAIETFNFADGQPTWLPLAGPANRQGRLAADAISGRAVTYDGVQGTAIAKVFDLTVASTGKNERTLQNEGIKYFASFTHSSSHATYYPGAIPLTIKLLFGEKGQLFGAQVIGQNGVDKRIDVLATALRFKAGVDDLSGLELAYAPPFSSAKDPVNMAGYVAGNILRGDVEIIQWHELAGLNPEETVLLDVREKSEQSMGFIPGSINIPLGQLRQRLEEIPRDKNIVVYCQIGLRAYVAARILMQHGFPRVKNLSGGFKTWQPVAIDLKMPIAFPDAQGEIAAS